MLNFLMDNLQARLETLFAKVRSLPEAQQAAAVDALTEIADAPYELSTDERAAVEPALERARRGEFVSEDETRDLLDKPWR